MARKIKMKEGSEVNACPKCGNDSEFTVHSSQCAEDCCEVWAVCKCGFDPTSYDQLGSNYRLEDVMGGCDDDNCIAAVSCWNDAIQELEGRKSTDQQTILK